MFLLYSGRRLHYNFKLGFTEFTDPHLIVKASQIMACFAPAQKKIGYNQDCSNMRSVRILQGIIHWRFKSINRGGWWRQEEKVQCERGELGSGLLFGKYRCQVPLRSQPREMSWF